MSTFEIIIICLCVLCLTVGIVVLVIILSKNKNNNTEEIVKAVKEETVNQQSVLRQELMVQTQSSVKNMGDMLIENQKSFSQSQSEKMSQIEERLKTFSIQNEQKLENVRQSMEDRLKTSSAETGQKLEDIRKSMEDRLKTSSSENGQKLENIRKSMEERLKTSSTENEQKLENIRSLMEKRLTYLQQDNNKQLEEMRKTVDDKLQKTLEDKMNKSFSLVNERLEQVYKGLGEMQNLAVGVGDLKKVLSNVKTRGILGEIQLGSILSEILSSEQYDENIATKKGSKNVVEFAIKLPAEDDSFIYLPIDSKFPGDTYSALRDAIEDGDKQKIEIASKALVARIKLEAKDIKEKYIDPPNTTEFAIMFLPFEGLYSEVVNRGLVEILQRDFKVNIAGPSTMAALLNSLQMGFKTLAVQKRSAEVWNVLGSVKQEFDKFNTVLVATQQRIDQANKELDKLVGVRTRQIQRKLKNIQSPTTEVLTTFDEEE